MLCCVVLCCVVLCCIFSQYSLTHLAHCHTQGGLHGKRKILLSLENSIELECWELGPHNIVDMGCDLLGWVGESIKSVKDLSPDDLVLDRDYGRDEHVVKGLCFHSNVKLLNTSRNFANQFLYGAADYRHARLRETHILAESLNHSNLSLRYAEQASVGGGGGGGGVSFYKVFVNCLGRNSLFSSGVDVEWGGEICSFKLTENTCGRKDYPAKLFKIQGFSTFYLNLYNITYCELFVLTPCIHFNFLY